MQVMMLKQNGCHDAKHNVDSMLFEQAARAGCMRSCNVAVIKFLISSCDCAEMGRQLGSR